MSNLYKVKKTGEIVFLLPTDEGLRDPYIGDYFNSDEVEKLEE